MFDFEKLDVYKKSKSFNKAVNSYILDNELEPVIRNQLSRASLSVVLNIAEGSGRFSKRSKRYFYVVARSSLFECVAVFDVLKDESMIENLLFTQLYMSAEELSKMLFVLIRQLER